MTPNLTERIYFKSFYCTVERTCDLDYEINCGAFDVRKYSGIEGMAASASSILI